jgi:hypothetical protein
VKGEVWALLHALNNREVVLVGASACVGRKWNHNR